MYSNLYFPIDVVIVMFFLFWYNLQSISLVTNISPCWFWQENPSSFMVEMAKVESVSP